MQDGIYHVQFATSAVSAGEGLIVLKAGSVNGGDAGYLYIGNLSETNGSITSKLRITRWNPTHTSVFGPLTQFELALTGQTTPNGFQASGTTTSMPGAQIKIVGRYLAAAA